MVQSILFEFIWLPTNYFEWTDIVKIIPLLIVNDLLFGGFHFIMHVYFPASHAIHHQLKDEKLNGVNAQSSSILDHCLTSIAPPYLSALAVGLSYPATVFWFMFCEYNSVKSHIYKSGHDYDYHILHHYNPKIHLGTSIGLFDFLFTN